MRKLTFVLIVFCAGISSIRAQSETQSFDADGIKVIFKPTIKNVIDVRIYFRGGVTNYPANQAGIEDIALDGTVKCGTKKYYPKAFKDTADKYGILLDGGSAYDYGYIKVNCISKYFDQGWDLFSEAVMNPIFDADEVKSLKDIKVTSNHNYESNPENRLDELQMQNAFVNTPYVINPAGTDETISKLTPDDLKNYYKTLLNKNKIFIVVVGNVTKQELFEKILLSFGNIPSKPYVPVELQAPAFNDNKLLTEKQAMATNYFGAVMNAPEFTSVNYVPFRLGISGLGGNLFHYLHSIRSLAYSSGTNIAQLKMPFAVMHATSTNVQEAISGMVLTLKDLQNRGFNDEWLQHLKSIYISRSYINEQSSSEINYNLGLAEILGSWQYADDLPKLVQMVTVEQINNAVNFYIVGLRWTYLGNPEAIEGFKIPVLNEMPQIK